MAQLGNTNINRNLIVKKSLHTKIVSESDHMLITIPDDFSEIWDNTPGSDKQCIKLRDNFNCSNIYIDSGSTESDSFQIILPSATSVPIHTKIRITVFNEYSDYIFIYGYTTDGTDVEKMILPLESSSIKWVRLNEYYGYVEMINVYSSDYLRNVWMVLSEVYSHS